MPTHHDPHGNKVEARQAPKHYKRLTSLYSKLSSLFFSHIICLTQFELARFKPQTMHVIWCALEQGASIGFFLLSHKYARTYSPKREKKNVELPIGEDPQ